MDPCLTVRRRHRSLLRAGLAALLLMGSAGVVQARREVTFNYPYSRVWTAAVRLMRVDFECTITEKDKDDGYFLFEYPDRGKSYPGSVELVPTKEDDVESVRVVIQIPAMPTYVESMIMDRLARKLEQEFGAPKAGKRPAQKPAPDSKDEADHGGEGDRDKPEGAPKPKPKG